MEATDVWSVLQGLGAIIAVALTVGFAALTAIRNRRQKTALVAAGRSAETTHLESTVAELVEVLAGKKQTKLNKGTLGLIDRFDALESKVDAHDSKLEDIAAGVATLLENRA